MVEYVVKLIKDLRGVDFSLEFLKSLLEYKIKEYWSEVIYKLVEKTKRSGVLKDFMLDMEEEDRNFIVSCVALWDNREMKMNKLKEYLGNDMFESCFRKRLEEGQRVEKEREVEERNSEVKSIGEEKEDDVIVIDDDSGCNVIKVVNKGEKEGNKVIIVLSDSDDE